MVSKIENRFSTTENRFAQKTVFTSLGAMYPKRELIPITEKARRCLSTEQA